MIKVRDPIAQDGELITNYRGKNLALNSKNRMYTQQRITLHKNREINGGITLGYCTIFTLMNRQFLLHFDRNEVYEVIGRGSEQVHIHLANTWFGMDTNFIEDNIYVNYIHLYVHCEYSQIATYSEFFELQFNFGLYQHVSEWYRKVQEEQNNN